MTVVILKKKVTYFSHRLPLTYNMSSVDKSAPPPGQVVGPPPDYSANQAPPAGYSGQQSSVVVMQQPAVFGACAACGVCPD